MTKRKKGRPAGGKNRKYKEAEGQLTRCQCGSTERGPYLNRHEQPFAGVDEQGQAFTHIVRRRTQCKACGQHRIDRHYENRVPGRKSNS